MKSNKPSPDSTDHAPTAFIELRQVVKVFSTPAGEFSALRGVDLTIQRGEFAAVVGKSGSGKSTLINVLTGIDRPTSGDVVVGSTHVQKLSESRLAAWRGEMVGIVFQFFQLLPALTLLENIMLPMDFCRKFSPRQRYKRALWLLEQVDLAECAQKLPSAVSGGQQQRAAIARALANDPPMLVADEPTGNLDSATAEAVFQLFKDQVAQGKTVLMVTHDEDLARRSGRKITIADGCITGGLGEMLRLPGLETSDAAV